MKKIFLLALFVSMLGGGVAYAEEQEYGQMESESENAQKGAVMTTQTRGTVALPENASDKAKEMQSDKKDNEEKGEQESEKGDDEKITKGMGETHRSVVADSVKNLQWFADRDPNGKELSEIIKAQVDSSEKLSAALDKVEKRGGFKTFLIGSDYKNIGAIRSEMVKIANQIEKLRQFAPMSYGAAFMTGIESEAQKLEEEQAKLDAFLKSKESKFSLFGWLFKKK